MENMDKSTLLLWFLDNIWKYSMELLLKRRANSQPAKLIQFWEQTVVALEPSICDISSIYFHECNKKRKAEPGT